MMLALDEPRQLKPRIEPLTGLRGVAALWVVWHHALDVLCDRTLLPVPVANFVSAGWLAVDLFFVLSGFVISYVHFQDFRAFRWVEYGRFLKLRLTRIYPAHLVIALLWLPLILGGTVWGFYELAPGVRHQYNLQTFLASLLLLNGCGIPRSQGWNLPSWSVGSEWFAYLAFPGLALALHRVSSKRMFLSTAALTILAMYVLALVVNDGRQYMPPERWALARVLSSFLVGCCIFGVARSCRFRGLRLVSAASCAAVLVLSVANIAPILQGAYVVAFAALVFGLATSGGLIARLLASSPFVWLGTVSYSLYLAHALVLVAVTHVATLTGLAGGSYALAAIRVGVYTLGSLVAAELLYRSVEEPSRRTLRARWIGQEPRPQKRSISLGATA